MKQIKYLAILLVASASVFLFACGSGEQKKTTTTIDTSQVKAADSQPKATEPAASTMPAHIVIIKHRVANFSKWKGGYEADDSARRAAGLTNYVLARGVGKDSNMVMVVLKAANILKAKEFASSKDLSDVMKKAGVSGPPAVSYLDVVMDDNSPIAATDRLMVTHKVKEWDPWKTVFDSHKQARIDAGLIDRALGYNSGDRHNVTVVFAVTDMAKAKAFIASKDLKDKMAEAGVDGPPSFFFFNIVQVY